MTYIDKYMELHPEADRAAIFKFMCPNALFDIQSEPKDYCTFKDIFEGMYECQWCWLRTYRGEEEMVDET